MIGGELVTRNEIMYNYSKYEYENAINRKNDLRNRSATFFGIGFTIISAVAAISFSVNESDFSNARIILLISAAILILCSLVLFLLIYSPSNQLIHSPENVIEDLRNIERSKENEKLIKYYKDRNDFRYIVSELSLAYVSERFTENSRMYDEKIKLFVRYFALMSLALIICLILLIISIAI